jgi:hypothetical protein
MRFDPQLHILRSVLQSLKEPKRRHEALTARHNLFAALEAEKYEEAAQWLDALEVTLENPPVEGISGTQASKAIIHIRKGLKDSREAAKL